MKKIFINLTLLLFLSSCELIVIGKRPIDVKTIKISRTNPVGTVILLKAELENENLIAASDFFASPYGHRIKAIDKLELYDQLPMLKNKIIKLQNKTNISEERLENDLIRVTFEYDYIKYFICDTKKIDSLYYIVNYNFQKIQY